MKLSYLIISLIVLIAACSPKNESNFAFSNGENSNSPTLIKSYSEYYLNDDISEYNLQNWRLDQNSEDSQSIIKNFTLENPKEFLQLKNDSVEIKRILISALNDSITSLKIELSPYLQSDLDKFPQSIMTEDLIFQISDAYSTKYGKPNSIDSTNFKKLLFIHWDFPDYSIDIDAKKNIFLSIFQVSPKDKERYKRHLENLEQMNLKDRLNFINDPNYPHFEGNTNIYYNTYEVSITYKSNYFDPQFSERFDRSYNKKTLKDSIEEAERVKKLKEKI